MKPSTLKLHTLKLLAPSFGLLLLAYVIPTVAMALGSSYFDEALFIWFGCITYLALALGAIKLTFNALLNDGAPVDKNVSCSEDMLVARGYADSAQILIMGAGTLSLVLGMGDDTHGNSFEAMLLFVTLRLGATLLMLGAVVMLVTHFKMRRI
ncbi:MAG: hypothetical protein V4805_07705 [Pseudomonadota bacterium]